MKAIQPSIKQLSGEESFRLCRLAGLRALVLLAIFLLAAPAARAQAPGYEQVSEPAKPAGGSELTYDKASGQYTCVWKTDKSWQGCRVLALRLTDETEQRVAFQFK